MRALRLLFVDDSEDDVLLETRALERTFSLDWRRVDSASSLESALSERWDLVISDYQMPAFGAPEALAIVRRLASEQPFMVVSGSIGEELAVEVIRAGAQDVVFKTNLSRLAPAVERTLEIARVRRERREAMEALREAVRARDDFLVVASHELKTPLTSLQLQVQTLLRQAGLRGSASLDDEVFVGKLAAMNRHVERLVRLIERMLDVTQVTTGALVLEPVRFDFALLVRQELENLAPLLTRAGCALTSELPPSLELSGDPERLSLVVSNLVTNAAKYGAGKPVHLRLDDEGERARLAVQDEGIGIAPDDLARIFGRFERGVSKHHYGGLGVGLWLAKEVVDAHGGTIEVTSRPGWGAAFVVTLPKTR